jgi:hypothetical protein
MVVPKLSQARCNLKNYEEPHPKAVRRDGVDHPAGPLPLSLDGSGPGHNRLYLPGPAPRQRHQRLRHVHDDIRALRRRHQRRSDFRADHEQRDPGQRPVHGESEFWFECVHRRGSLAGYHHHQWRDIPGTFAARVNYSSAVCPLRNDTCWPSGTAGFNRSNGSARSSGTAGFNRSNRAARSSRTARGDGRNRFARTSGPAGSDGCNRVPRGCRGKRPARPPGHEWIVNNWSPGAPGSTRHSRPTRAGRPRILCSERNPGF